MSCNGKARLQRVAFIPIVVTDVGYILWGGMAALLPGHLLGPGSKPILAAEYESYTGHAWSELPNVLPRVQELMTVLFRVYGAYNVVIGILGLAIALTAFRRGERWAWWAILVGHTIALGAAMRFDWVLHAVGPFELTEYLGLLLIWLAAAVTYQRSARPVPA